MYTENVQKLTLIRNVYRTVLKLHFGRPVRCAEHREEDGRVDGKCWRVDGGRGWREVQRLRTAVRSLSATREERERE